MSKNMRVLIIVFITALISISSVKTSLSQNLYWVNGSGEWSDPSHWSLSSGGESANIIPSENNNVIFDDNSFIINNQTVLIKGSAICNDFQWNAEKQTAVLKSSSFLFKSNTKAEIEVHGSIAINETLQSDFYGNVVLKSNSKEKINIEGSFVGDIIIDSDNGEYGLISNFLSESNIILKSGSFKTNDYIIEINGLITETNSIKSIDLGKSIIKSSVWDLSQNKNLNVEASNTEIYVDGKNIDKNLKTGGFNFPKLSSGTKSVFTWILASEDITCSGGFDGKITVTITSGGTADFLYVLKDASDNVVQSSGWVSDLSWDFNNLTAETYLVRITDSDSDWNAQSQTVNEPDPLKAEDIVINKGLTCAYSSDAELEAFASGGTPPYSYQWIKYNFGTTDWDTITTDDIANKVLTGVDQGWYKSLVRDSKGCGTLGSGYEESELYFLEGYGYDAYIPNSIVISGVSSTNTCSGADNGTITISATGGTGSMTYAIVRESDSDSTIDASGVFSGLQADTYRVYAIDANDCFKRASDEVISTLANPTASIIPASPADACPGVALPIDGNPTHGDGTSFVSHTWNGADAGLLDNQNIQDPNFTSNVVGFFNVTYTVTDNNGCIGTDALIINVNDLINPVAVCQNITVQLDGTGSVSITGAQIDNGSSDNCTPAGNLNFSVAPNSFDCGDIGNNPVTLTVTDLAGNTGTCGATVIVEDDTDPTITCPGNVSVDNDAGICTTVVNGLAPTTSDNCSIALQTWTMSGSTTGNSPGVGINDISGTTFSSGVTTVTYHIEDPSGNIAECSFTITVNDTEDPGIICPADVNVNTSDDGAGDCSTTAVLGSPGTSDNCAVNTVIAQVGGSTINPATYVFPLGITTVTWIVDDAAGNTASCDQDITVVDNEDPIVACQDITIELDATGNAIITANDIDAGSSDNCGIASIIASQTAFNCGDIGANPITLTVTDNAGNTANCIATVTVEDIIDPTITCPGNVTVDNDPGICTTVVNGLAPTTTDNCSVVLQTWNMTGATNGSSPAVGINDISGTIFSSGITTITYHIEDISGNFAECSFTVTVNDTEDPSIICPGNVTANSSDDGNGDCSTTAVLGSPITSDNCAINSVIAQVGGITINPATYVFPVGVTTVTWIVDDAAGNTASCDQDVTVVDDENPTITCPSDVTANSSDDATGDCASIAVLGTPTTGDNCGVNTVIAQVGGLTIDPATYQFPVGVTIVTWIVDDAEGNIASCNQNVTIVDDEDPTITCPSDVSIIQDGACTAIVNAITPTIGDNCGVVLQTWTMTGATVNSSAAVGINDASGEIFEIGVTTVTYRIEDAAGNFTECSFDVDVYDVVYGGLIDADQTVCYNTSPDPFTDEASATVCGGLSYQWQMRSESGTWADIAGATNATYSETNPLIEITYYNRKAISDLGFGTAYSDTITINIQPEAIAFAGKDTLLCYDTPFQIPDADTTFTSSVLWEVYTGNGTFNNPTLINSTYTPAPSDGGTVVELVLHASGIGACGENTDTVRVEYLSELLVAIGKESPFTIDSMSTHIDVYFEISSHNYIGDLSLYLVSPVDSVVELKTYCSGFLSPATNITLDFYNDPLDTSALAGATVDDCFPVSGRYEFVGDWKKKLHGQDPANGSWRVRISDHRSISGSDGFLDKATITFTDENKDGDFESILYADSLINKPILEGSVGTPAITEHALPITGLTTSCFGLCDATAIATATGGLSPYVEFAWSNTLDFSSHFSLEDTLDLCAGKYYVQVTDSHGCTAIDSVVVGEPDEIKILSSYVKDATCNGQASGEIMLVLTGGTDVNNLFYTPDDGTTWYASGDTIKNLIPDDYLITIRDITGCEKDTSITIDNPAAIQPGFVISFITCSGESDGEIVSTPVNGTAPYDFSWSTGDSDLGVNTDTINGLGAGIYSVIITDVNLCTQTYDTTLVDPAELLLTGIPRNKYCIDANTTARDANKALGQIVVQPSGGSGFYDYVWTGPVGFTTVNNDTISLLDAGSYSVTVTDTYGCTRDISIDITDDITYDLTDLSISIEDTSICWYNYVYLNGTYNPAGAIADSLFIQGLGEGGSAFDTIIHINSLNPFRDSIIINSDSRLQIIRVQNEYCLDDINNVELTYTSSFNLDILDEIDGNSTDDTIYLKGLNTTALMAFTTASGLTFEWSPPDALETPYAQITNVSPEESGWYRVVAESDDCIDSSRIYLEYIPSITPNGGFSPNGDGINDYWKIKYIDKFQNNVVTVYNRWGVKVFEQKGYDNDDESKRWNGTKNGKDLNSGTYYYIIVLNDAEFNPLTGPITIVR
jgi:gliding motility-associated-like protein